MASLFEAYGLIDPQEQPPEKKPEPRGMTGVAKDVGISALKGAIAVPEAAVGLADLVTGGYAGKAAEAAGFRPAEARAMLEDQYSQEQKDAFARVQAADGFGDTLMEAIRNPSVIGHSVVESLPSMGAGGVLARGGLAVLPKLSPVLAGAFGEGATQAGQAAEAARQASPDGLLSARGAGSAVLSGVLDTAIAAGSGGLAKRLGIADIDTLLAGAKTNPVAAKGLTRRVLEGMFTEGILEELPQSIQEQVLQNYGQGKPLDEGVNQAAVLGMLSGAAMGGGANVLAGAPKVPEVGPLSRAANQAQPAPIAAAAGMEAPAGAGGFQNVAQPGGPTINAGGPQAEPQPPQVDPVAERIKKMPAGDREEALAAYSMLSRDDLPKGVRQYNSRLLDDLLAKMDEKPAAEASDPAALLSQGMERDPLQAALHERANEQAAQANLTQWMARAQPMPLQAAQEIQQAAAAQGRVWEIVPHAAGQGFTVVPAAWLTPSLRGQTAAAIPLDTAPTGVLRADARGNVAPETGAQAIDKRNAQAAADAEARRKASLGLTPDVEAMQSGATRAKPQATPMLTYDVTPTGIVRVDRSGTAAPETRAQRIDVENARRARDAEAQRKRDLGLTPDVEAVQAGRTRAPLPEMQEGDLGVKSTGKPFATPAAAQKAQAKNGGEVLRVKGGWVVRTQAAQAAQPVQAELEAVDGGTDTPGGLAAGTAGSGSGAAERSGEPADGVGSDAGRADAVPAAEGGPVPAAGGESAAAVGEATPPNTQASPPISEAKPPKDATAPSGARWTSADAPAREALLLSAGWKPGSPGLATMKAQAWDKMTQGQRNRIAKAMEAAPVAKPAEPAQNATAAQDSSAVGAQGRADNPAPEAPAETAPNTTATAPSEQSPSAEAGKADNPEPAREPAEAAIKMLPPAERWVALSDATANDGGDPDKGQRSFRAFTEMVGAVGEKPMDVWNRWSNHIGATDLVNRSWKEVLGWMEGNLPKSLDGYARGLPQSVSTGGTAAFWQRHLAELERRAESHNRYVDQLEKQVRDVEEFGGSAERIAEARAAIDSVKKAFSRAEAQAKRGLADAEAREAAEKEQAEAERLAAYKPFDAKEMAKKPTPASVSQWFKATYKGAVVWSNGHIIDLAGEPHLAGWETRMNGLREGDGSKYPVDRILPDKALTQNKPATPIGIFDGKFGNAIKGIVYFDLGGELTAADSNYVRYFLSKYKGATFKGTDVDMPLTVWQGDKLVGMLAPVRMGDKAPSVAEVKGLVNREATTAESTPTPAPAAEKEPPKAEAPKRNAKTIVRDLAAARPFDKFEDVRADAADAVRKEHGQQAVDDLNAGFMRNDMAEAVHAGQYQGIREWAAKQPVPILESQISHEAAMRAHAGTSHSPDERGRGEIRDYVRTLAAVWRGIDAKYAAADEATQERVREQFQKLRDGYAQRTNAYLSAHANVMSSMIAGPARFPVASNRKKSDTADRRAQEAQDYLARGRKAIARAFAGPVDASLTSELASIGKRIAEAEAAQEKMKAANAALRKGDDAALAALGFDEARIAALKKPDFAGRTGFADYSLKNNNAEIRRLKERQADVQKRIDGAAAAAETQEAAPQDGGPRIVQDAEANRVRILFDGKPDEATRNALKAAGFRWSPTNAAWQRQLTTVAVKEAERIVASLKTTDAPQFRRTEVAEAASEASNRAGRIQQFIDQITAKWANAPKVVVVESMQDERVPQKVRDTDAAQRSEGADEVVHGFHYEGKVYLVAEGIADAEEALTTLAHEALGHYGLRGFFGERLKPILQQVVAMRGKDVRAKAADYGLVVDKAAVRAELGKGATDEDVQRVINARLLYASEEVLAEMAQATPTLGFVKRAIAAIRSFLRDTLGLKLELTDDEIVRNYIIPAREFVVKGRAAGKTGAEPSFSRSAPVTASAAFGNWFKGSKVVDAEGKPLVVYHGTQRAAEGIDSFGAGRGYAGQKSAGVSWFTSSPRSASGYANWIKAQEPGEVLGNPTVYPAYLSLKNPARLADLERLGISEDPEMALYEKGAIKKLKTAGYDGVMWTNAEYAGPGFADDNDVTAVAFSPAQIKSAIGNRGTFDHSDPNIMFSRTATGTNPATGQTLREQIMQGMNDTFSAPGKLSWWDKTVGTQYNLAQRSPLFKRVFDSVQDFLGDVSLYATEAADLAPKILPKLETWRDIGKKPIAAADNKAVSAPIFEGTLAWTRGEDGKPVKVDDLQKAADLMSVEQKAQALLKKGAITEGVLKMWQGMKLDQYQQAVTTAYQNRILKPGIVWTDEELKSQFRLTDAQIGLYREFRAAVDKSLTHLAISDMVRFAGKDAEAVRQMAIDSGDVGAASAIIIQELDAQAADNPERAEVLRDSAKKVFDKAKRAQELMAEGYAPLSRFGHYTVDAVDENGERVFFGMFETAREAALMARKMKGNFPKATITRGTVSEQEYKLFAGVSPETVELFGEMLGLETQGNDAASMAFQAYIKVAKSNRSAMKRLIARKGIAGFSEDVGRVLAGFIYSNARQTSQNLHMGDMTDAAAAIPKGQGELKDQAAKLVEYIKNPQEEAQAFRGLLFAQYLGGSVASAMVNMLQPVQMTFPYLSQFGGAKNAAANLTRAYGDVRRKTTGDAALDAALKKAEEEGIVAPQEVHQLIQQAAGRGVLKSGDGTAIGDARAKASNSFSRLSLAWGKIFSAAEQLNRRATFIAAYRTAVAQKMDDPAGFAEKAIAETQGVYNKGNKPNWARGAIGGTVFTFRQYSIAYVELLHRMATQGGPEGKKAALLMLGMLFLMSGAGGLPFAEDVEDVVDGVMQRLGYNFNSKLAKQQFFENLLGKDLGRFAEHGVSGLPGSPIDVSGRLGLGNLIPGTGLLVDKEDHTRDVTEFLGAGGDFATRMFKGANQALEGNLLEAGKQVAPRAAFNAAKALEMYTTGVYKDDRGRKVIDVDGFDALGKALGFQPSGVAQVQEATGAQQRLIAQAKAAEARFADRWAKAVADGDQDELQAVRRDIAQYNRDNQFAPVTINRAQITKRIAAMRESKASRIERTAPREIRAQVRHALETP